MPVKKGQIELSALGRKLSLPYALRRQRGFRRLRCSLDFKGTLCLAVPWGCPEDQAWDFVHSKADWIAQRWQEMSQEPGLKEFLQRQGWLSYDGARVPLRFVEKNGSPAGLQAASTREVVLQVPSGVASDTDIVLSEILLGFSRRAIPVRVQKLSEEKGISCKRIAVRDQRSRWGSCSCSGTISLNWRLCLVPPEVQDYVIYHELAHRRHMNHSAKFWEEVSRYCPEYGMFDAFLREKGNCYMRLGRRRC
ncbi:MAG: M48 family metallopeptidase [Opitutales bacterium]|nr:M48 family metallopeptidase [Opitutales bacterium]MCH8540427.1 M48 family metallopeptidase [Opitutales bacterium]